MDNDTKMKNEFYNREVLGPLAFVIPIGILMLAAIFIPAEYNFLTNPEVAKPFWFVIGWYASGFASLYLIYMSGKIKSNIIGTVFCIVLGPITLAAFSIAWAFRKTGVWK